MAHTEMLNKEEEAILRNDKKFMEAYNNGNAKAISSFFTEDAVRVDPFGNIQHGRQEIESSFENLLSKLPNSKIEFSDHEIRMLTDEYAVYKARLEITTPELTTPLKGYAVEILKKEGGDWKILEVHPKFLASEDDLQNR